VEYSNSLSGRLCKGSILYVKTTTGAYLCQITRMDTYTYIHLFTQNIGKNSFFTKTCKLYYSIQGEKNLVTRTKTKGADQHRPGTHCTTRSRRYGLQTHPNRVAVRDTANRENLLVLCKWKNNSGEKWQCLHDTVGTVHTAGGKRM
jgi:hypothetical protein